MSPPRLSATAVVPTPPGSRPPRWQQRRDEYRRQLDEAARSEGRTKAPPRRPTVGSFVGLGLPVAFPDRPATVPREEIDAFCNAPGYRGFGNQGSVRDYFADMSGGQLDYRTLVLPYFTAPQPFAFYDDPAVPWTERAKLLVTEALAFHAAAGVDFGALSTDAQQAVYATNLFHAGAQSEHFGQGLWPHAWHLDRARFVADDKAVVDYQVSAIGDALALGVYCHENGHMLCDFPDLYSRADARRGVGRYCLMCTGCHTTAHNPAGVSAYLRWHAGWATAQPLGSGTQFLPPSTAQRMLIHRRPGVPTEYFLLEYRRAQGRDAALPASGLAVWHVDELGDNFDTAHGAPGHQVEECLLLQADGLDELQAGDDEGGDAGDLFVPGQDSARLGAGRPLALRWRDGSDAGAVLQSLAVDGDGLRLTVDIA